MFTLNSPEITSLEADDLRPEAIVGNSIDGLSPMNPVLSRRDFVRFALSAAAVALSFSSTGCESSPDEIAARHPVPSRKKMESPDTPSYRRPPNAPLAENRSSREWNEMVEDPKSELDGVLITPVIWGLIKALPYDSGIENFLEKTYCGTAVLYHLFTKGLFAPATLMSYFISAITLYQSSEKK